eukprot:GFUD01068124.1.p1 GENE.GFUD01068124.1~~GFUD01068124.1.p1  ORF type:complete len:866 (-),score=218.50 GFUD01068124.1:2289-4886(-)
MSLPYPVNNQPMVHIPDPDDPVPLPAYNNQPYGNTQMYPQLPQQLPYPTQGSVYLPPAPSQNQSYMPENVTPYPPQNYAPPNPMHAGYPAQNHMTYPPQNQMTHPPQNQMTYPPQNQMAHPPQNPNAYPATPGNMPAYPQPGYPAHPTAPLPASGSFYESVGGIDLNEGLLSRGGEMMNLGIKVAKVAGDVLGFGEKKGNSQRRGHSFYYPKVPDVGSSIPSYFNDLTKNLPKDANSMKIKNLYSDQDYHDLVKKSQARGELFEDSRFPANNRLLTDNGGGQNFVISYFGKREFRETEIQWLRPHEISQSYGLKPEMYVGERDRFDINQGEIGDCWFLASLANLADDAEAFNRVVPTKQEFRNGYTGIFRFRFFRFGEWVEVVIDDRLPTRNGKLIYLKAKEPNEFWSPLLEKAYAKLYGSYTALEGGLTIEASVDFTGGIPEMIDLSNLRMEKETLFYNMVKAYENKAFMSCSLSNSRSQAEAVRLGLQARHAYTITKVIEVRSKRGKNTIPLIRMRNPHGNSKEWKGAWSDQDAEWRNLSDSVKHELGLTFDDDGEFYMNFNLDFLKYFGEVEIVHKTPASMMEQQSSSRKYEVIYFQGAWRGETAGGCGNDTIRNFVKNPQYMFSLTDPDPYDDKMTCPIIISLAQKVKERKTEHAIGFRIYQVPQGVSVIDVDFVSRNQPMGKTDQYINLREVSKRFQFPPGNYCVIPTTFSRGDEGEFLLRTFVEKYWGASDQGAKQSFKEGGGITGGGDKPGAGSGYKPSPAPAAPSGSARPSGGFAGHGNQNVINIPIHVEGGNVGDHGNGKVRERKRDKLAKLGLDLLEKHIPNNSIIGKLREYYNFPQDRAQERDILKDIINSIKK